MEVSPVLPHERATRSAESGAENVSVVLPESARELMELLDRVAVNVQRTTRGVQQVTTCVGFDFGTSSTKVVIGLPTMADRPMYPVQWPSALRSSHQVHGVNEYLLPSEVSFNGRSFRLESAPNSFRYRRLKQSLLGLEDVPSPPAELPAHSVATVAFLALALREARRWFFTTKYERLGKFALDWTLLVGIPTESADRFAQADLYRHRIRAAWLASVMPGEVTPALVQRAFEHVELVASPKPWGCETGIIPEVAAEVLGYGSSPHRRDDVHIIVDVGAGTLDVCAFIFPPSKPAPHFLTAEVLPYGAQRLHDDRCRALERAASARLHHLMDSFDPFKPLPEKADEYLPQQDGTRTLALVDSELVRRVVRSIAGVVKALRHGERDPNSPVWRAGVLPTFLCGGGGLLPVYRRALDDASSSSKSLVAGFKGLEVQFLPSPESVRGTVGQAGFHRLAVAWGLARPPENVGDIRRPSEILNIPPFAGTSTVPTRGNEYVDKDQV